MLEEQDETMVWLKGTFSGRWRIQNSQRKSTLMTAGRPIAQRSIHAIFPECLLHWFSEIAGFNHAVPGSVQLQFGTDHAIGVL